MSTSEMPGTSASAPTPRTGHAADSTLWRKDASGWTGWITFAAIMAVTMGVYEAIMGLVALFNDEYYLVGPSGLVVELDYTVWGWVHLILGVVAVAGGLALMQGRTWGRVLVICLAALSALVNLGFLSAYPIWCTILIALDIIIIYALTVRWDEATT
jgi:hypothetical protein